MPTDDFSHLPPRPPLRPYDPENLSFPSTALPCPSDQAFVAPFGCLAPCSAEQLARDGYRPPKLNYPPYPIDLNPIVKHVQEERRNYTGTIKIRCIEPPLLPPPEKLTIVEVRPPAPPGPPPQTVPGVRPPTPKLPPLIIRERPPTPPTLRDKEICYVKLDAPPAPPAQRIFETYDTPPPKPRDIIIERWLPYKRQLPDPHAKEIIHPPPYNPEPIRNIVIQHYHVEPNINHRIEKDPQPKPTNPDTYIQEHGDTLVDRRNLLPTVLTELSSQRVNEDIIQRLRAIFRVPCNETHEPMSPHPFLNFQ